MKIQFGLMGGLGNQLFQTSAALNIAKKYNQNVILNPNFGHVRENAHGSPEILSFNLPTDLVVVKRGILSNWIPRLFGHARKIAISPAGFEKYAFYKILINMLSRAQAILLAGLGAQIRFIEEVGFHEFEEISDSTIFVGYFQSYKYLIEGDTKVSMMSLSCSEYIEIQEYYKKLRLNTNPLVVHIRLGDYLKESEFGVVTEKYYQSAVETEFQTGLYDSIWLFSDDFNLAKNMIPNQFKPKVRMVYEAQESSAATLEIMRLGKGYVIGNSTFSWWGATLSHTAGARVTAPSPWFQGMDEPIELIPPHWQRIQVWGV